MPKRKQKQRSLAPLYLIIAGVVVLLGVLIWAAASRPSGLSSNPNAPYPNIPRVSLRDAKAAFDQKTAVFVDVRDADSFAAGHIPGAINIPLGEVPTRAAELDPNAWIITYCT